MCFHLWIENNLTFLNVLITFLRSLSIRLQIKSFQIFWNKMLKDFEENTFVDHDVYCCYFLLTQIYKSRYQTNNFHLIKHASSEQQPSCVQLGYNFKKWFRNSFLSSLIRQKQIDILRTIELLRCSKSNIMLSLYIASWLNSVT